MSKNYLITGGAGFIGSHLSDALLSQDHHVTIIDNFSTGLKENVSDKVKIIDANIVDYPKWDNLLENCDGCYHLAAVASVAKCEKDHDLAHRTNVLGTLKVFEHATKHHVPVVFTSSSAIYGDNKTLPLTELSTPQPESIYAVDKLSAELYSHVYHESSGLDVICLRLFNVFGPRQRFQRNLDSGVIANFLHQMQRGETLTIFGDGEQTRDFIYVEDVVRALQVAMSIQNKNAAIYNVCSSEAHSVNNVIQHLQNHLSTPVKKIYEPHHAGDILHSLGSAKKIEKALNFVPEYNLESGIAAMMAFSKKAVKTPQ